MPIKTTGTGANRRIITKLVDGQRRVSCSCCEETGCCMYPADQLGVGYQEADLPDEVRITILDGYVFPGAGDGSRIAARSGSEYSYGSYGAIANLKLGVDNGAWVFIPNAYGSVRCLVGDGEEGELAGFLVEDTFADTYNVYIPYDGGIDIEVTRESLCRWYGTVVIGGLTYGATLYYNDGTGEIATLSPAHTWNISPFVTGGGIEILGTKTSQQGTPLGNYTATQGGDIYTYVVSP